jgi:D-alanyl-lipoteichoic acid acyltransferase DltB (MBOAT superfamily)
VALPAGNVANNRAAGASNGPFAPLDRGRFALQLAQLAVLLYVIWHFQIESEGFQRLAMLTVAGFAVHSFLPFRVRLPFFALLSMAGIVLVLGPVQAGWLVVLGAALIAILQLRVGFWWKALLLLGAGGALAVPRWTYPRWGIGEMPWSSAIYPVLGSMFVLRSIVYLYDRSHEKEPPRLAQTLAYFFMSPNVCFPLFPVVDFKKFCRNYYAGDPHRIYQVGIEWMWRGLVQLVLYRLIYFHLTIDPVAISHVGELAVYMLSTFLLYVRVSGQFHLVVGMLHLFGFALPETHHRYLLASSFTDFWRRINIYWKDFMLKVFYYPAYFRLRKLGDTRALVLATVYVFACTWLLHMVQWFWIRGSVLFEWNDVLFWSLLGALVVVNSLHESEHGRVRALGNPERTLGEAARLVLSTLGTFTTICVLWSLWSAESVSDWLLMLMAGSALPPSGATPVVLVLAALVAGVGLATYAVWKSGGGSQPAAMAELHSAPLVLATSLALIVVTSPRVGIALGDRDGVLASLRAQSLNRRDAEQFQRGYYENLVEVRKFHDAELWRILEKVPHDRSLRAAALSRLTGDQLDYELVPHATGQFVGAVVEVNRWGMRDKDYPRGRPPGTFRLAVLGPSITMASGVAAREGFEALVEERLNAERAGGEARYELLNFGVAGYTPLHVLYQLERTVFTFEPNAVLYVGHSGEVEAAARRWAAMLARGLDLKHEYLNALSRRTGITRETGPMEARRRLRPLRAELLAWVYSRIVADCLERGVTPAFVYMPRVTDALEPWRAPDRTEVLRLAREAGFLVVDLSNAFDGHAPSTLWISENDGHPNALGNRLVADRLHERVRKMLASGALDVARRQRPAGSAAGGPQ